MSTVRNIWYFHPYAGGPGLGNSARPFHMASVWIQLGIRATIFCNSWHHLMSSKTQRNNIEVIEGVPYCFVPTRMYKGNGLGRILNMADYCYALLQKCNKYKSEFGIPDLIIASSPHPYSILSAWLLAKFWRCKLVFEVRDLWPESLVELANVPKWHPLVIITSWIERFAYRHSDACVSLLPNAKAHMSSKGLNPNKFFYIPNGALFDSSAACEASPVTSEVVTFAQNLVKQGAFVVVYPGAMGPPNNIEPLLHAAKLLSIHSNLEVHFVLVGPGSEVHRLKDLTKALMIKNIHFFPPVDRKIAVELMSVASAGYVSVRRLPIYRNGISFNKLFEYMQTGLPVIFAADVPCNPVVASGCGIVAPPDEPRQIADAIAALAALPLAKREAMGQAGISYVRQHHDYRSLAAHYTEIFD